MRRVHLAFGIVALMVFAFTGRVMRTHTPPLPELGENVRLMYRSRHIYLFTSGMANLLLGVYLAPSRSGAGRRVQNAGSVLFLVAPVLLCAAFFVETTQGLTGHLWCSHFGIYALFAGTLLHFLHAVLPERWA